MNHFPKKTVTAIIALCLLTATAPGRASFAAEVAKPAPPQAKPTPPGQTLDNLVNSWLKRPEIQHSFVGVEVMELPTGKVLFSSNGNRRFAPASTTKVLTCSCAYSTLGPNFTYDTKLFTEGKLSGDTVHGDLLIVPDQDPSLSRDDIRQLLSALTVRKVHKIDGSLRLAMTPGGFNQFLPSWLIEDYGQEYSPVCSDLVIDRNISQGILNLKGVRTLVQSASEHFDALQRSLLASDVAAGWITLDPLTHDLRAYIGSGMTDKSPLPVTDPDEYNTALANDILQDMGIHPRSAIGSLAVKLSQPAAEMLHSLRSHSGNSDSTPAGTLIGEHFSRPMSALIRYTLHKSDNLYAQQILRTLGLPAANAKGAQLEQSATLEDVGLGRLSRWLVSIGVPAQEAILFDGCGLSRKNGISPHALNLVLKFMAGPKVDGPFLGLMKPSGTATGKGQFFFKTGSMDTVRSIAGVLGTAGGQQFAVTIIINDHVQSIKNLGGTLTELISLLNEITNITYVQVKPTVPGAPTEEKAVVQLTRPVPGGVSYGRHSRRRKHR